MFPLPVYANYADAELNLMPHSYLDLVFRSTDEEEGYRYAATVFCFASERNRDVHATYSASLSIGNYSPRVIFRKRLRLPQAPARRSTGSAS